MKFSLLFASLATLLGVGVIWLFFLVFDYSGHRSAPNKSINCFERDDLSGKQSRTNSKILAVAIGEEGGDDHEITMGKLNDLVKDRQNLSRLEIQGLLSLISGPKPKGLSDEQWEERVNVILNLLRRQEVQASIVQSACPGLEVGTDSKVPGLTEYLLKTAETSPSKVLRLYAMQHMCLWYSKEGDSGKRREIIQSLSKLACELALQQNLWVNFGSGRSPRV
jgi:hypothetical protein